MKQLFKKYWISFVTGVVAFMILALWFVNGVNNFGGWGFPVDRNFDQLIWSDSGLVDTGYASMEINPRYYMVHDLERRFLRIGLKKEEVIHLLGEPDFHAYYGDEPNEGSLSYFVGIVGFLYFGHPYSYEIKIDSNGIVQDFYKDSHAERHRFLARKRNRERLL